MPEGPEVAYLANYLTDRCKEDTVRSIKILKGRYVTHGAPEHFKEFVADLPLKLVGVERKAKVIVLRFEKGWSIVSKLGMMGWWYVTGDKPEWMTGTPNIEFQMDDTTLCYHDRVSYGTLRFTKDDASIVKDMERLAPEVEKVTLSALMERLSTKKTLLTKPLDEALMDQEGLVSGVGNYLKSEILYEARIAPKRRVDSLTRDDWVRFISAAKRVFRRKFKSVGNMDSYTKSMYVYGKQMDPKGNRVESYKTKDNRTTYWVPDLQE